MCAVSARPRSPMFGAVGGIGMRHIGCGQISQTRATRQGRAGRMQHAWRAHQRRTSVAFVALEARAAVGTAAQLKLAPLAGHRAERHARTRHAAGVLNAKLQVERAARRHLTMHESADVSAVPTLPVRVGLRMRARTLEVAYSLTGPTATLGSCSAAKRMRRQVLAADPGAATANFALPQRASVGWQPAGRLAHAGSGGWGAPGRAFRGTCVVAPAPWTRRRASANAARFRK